MKVAERRKYRRVKISLPAGVQLKQDGRFFLGSIASVGAGGIGLLMDVILPPGSTVMLTFELQENVRVDRAEGVVARTHQVNGRYFSGVYFNGIDNATARKIDRYVETVLFVGGLKPFAELSDEEGWLLRKTSAEMLFERGHVFFRQGEPGENFFMIESGEVEIINKSRDVKPAVAARLGAGDFFGEMALLDNSARSATAKAASGGSAFCLRKRDFSALLAENEGLAVKLLRVFVLELGKRVRENKAGVADSFFWTSAASKRKRNEPKKNKKKH